MEDKKAPAEEEEWTPLKRPLLLLGSLSLASSFVAYKKKHLNWFKTSYACACVTFGPAMVLYALPERSEQLEEKLFFVSSSSNDDNNNDNETTTETETTETTTTRPSEEKRGKKKRRGRIKRCWRG